MIINNDNTIETSLRYNRANNVAKCVMWQTFAMVIVTVGPFLLRSIIIREMGMEILGLQSFFQTILTILNLSELSFSNAMVFFLIKPLSEGNYLKINALLATMKRIYMLIGVVIIVIGACIFPFLSFLIKSDDLSLSDIYLFYITFMISGVLRFFFFIETISLLNALQRLDIYYKIAIIVNTCEYLFQALALILLHSYFLYILCIGIASVVSGLLRQCIIHKIYPNIIAKGYISKLESRKIRKKSLAIFGHQMDEQLLNSIDNLFITKFIGLSAVAMYGNYFFVITAVTMFINIIFSSLQSAVGNALITEGKESNILRFRCILWLNAVIVGCAVNCIFHLYQDFIYIWTGDNSLGMSMVILLCVFFYISQFRKSVLVFKNALGKWDNDALKPYVSMGVDLILDIILIQIIGIKGAIISSIICLLFIEIPWETKVLFNTEINIPIADYMKTLAKYTAVNLFVIVLTTNICNVLFYNSGIIIMIYKFFICIIISTVTSIVVYRKNECAVIWIDTIKTLFKR